MANIPYPNFLYHLPDDLWSNKILQYIDPSQRWPMRLTCKRMHAVVKASFGSTSFIRAINQAPKALQKNAVPLNFQDRLNDLMGLEGEFIPLEPLLWSNLNIAVEDGPTIVNATFDCDDQHIAVLAMTVNSEVIVSLVARGSFRPVVPSLLLRRIVGENRHCELHVCLSRNRIICAFRDETVLHVWLSEQGENELVARPLVEEGPCYGLESRFSVDQASGWCAFASRTWPEHISLFNGGTDGQPSIQRCRLDEAGSDVFDMDKYRNTLCFLQVFGDKVLSISSYLKIKESSYGPYESKRLVLRVFSLASQKLLHTEELDGEFYRAICSPRIIALALLNKERTIRVQLFHPDTFKQWGESVLLDDRGNPGDRGLIEIIKGRDGDQPHIGLFTNKYCWQIDPGDDAVSKVERVGDRTHAKAASSADEQRSAEDARQEFFAAAESVRCLDDNAIVALVRRPSEVGMTYWPKVLVFRRPGLTLASAGVPGIDPTLHNPPPPFDPLKPFPESNAVSSTQWKWALATLVLGLVAWRLGKQLKNASPTSKIGSSLQYLGQVGTLTGLGFVGVMSTQILCCEPSSWTYKSPY